MKKILHIIESLQVGGAENLLCNTITELTDYQHLVVTVFADNNLSLLPSNAGHISLGATNKATLLLKLPALKKVIRTFGPHLVHAHLYFSTILAKAATPTRIPLVFTQHCEFSKNAAKWYYAFTDRILSSKKQTCIAVSDVVLKDYVKTTGFKGRTKVLGIYIPDRYFTLSKSSNDDGQKRLKIVAVGNIKSIKNQRYILEAFAALTDLPVQCDIYGEGAERVKLEQEARQRNIPVFFKGPISDSGTVLPQYDLYMMPSLTEGFPLALFEAMAASLPAIVSDIPVFHEHLGAHGEYVSLQEPGQVRSVITRYLQHTHLLSANGAIMKQIAFQKASRETYLRQLRAIYAQTIGDAQTADVFPT